MTGLLVALVIVLIIILLYLWCSDWVANLDLISVSAGDEEYRVHGDYPNNKEAARVLSILNKRLIEFLRYLKKKYQINTQYGDQPYQVEIGGPNKELRHGIIQRILQNYNPEAIIENDPKDSTDTSYTVAKGKELHICLRNKNDPNKLHNPNDMMFVLLHEISHMGNKGWHHLLDFWTAFKFVLHEARTSGVHYPVNYAAKPINYCGLDVNYSPYFDEAIKSIWKEKSNPDISSSF